MSDATEYNLLDKALVSMLSTRIGRPVGLMDVPPNPGNSYAILEPIASGGEEGSWSHPAEQRDMMYQIRCVGTGAEQARWVQMKVSQAFSQYGVTVVGVLGVTEDSVGALTREQDKVYNAVSTFIIKARIRQDG